MKLETIAPRLARARDQMNEVERVLGWVRDKSWTGGFYVLVPLHHWTRIEGDYRWVSVERVTAGATPYPIKGGFKVFETNFRYDGQWAYWEVAGIRFVGDNFPEIYELHADSTTGPPPRPPLRQPWGETTPPCSEDTETRETIERLGALARKLKTHAENMSLEEINRAIRPGPLHSSDCLATRYLRELRADRL